MKYSLVNPSNTVHHMHGIYQFLCNLESSTKIQHMHTRRMSSLQKLSKRSWHSLLRNCTRRKNCRQIRANMGWWCKYQTELSCERILNHSITCWQKKLCWFGCCKHHCFDSHQSRLIALFISPFNENDPMFFSDGIIEKEGHG